MSKDLTNCAYDYSHANAVIISDRILQNLRNGQVSFCPHATSFISPKTAPEEPLLHAYLSGDERHLVFDHSVPTVNLTMLGRWKSVNFGVPCVPTQVTAIGNSTRNPQVKTDKVSFSCSTLKVVISSTPLGPMRLCVWKFRMGPANNSAAAKDRSPNQCARHPPN